MFCIMAMGNRKEGAIHIGEDFYRLADFRLLSGFYVVKNVPKNRMGSFRFQREDDDFRKSERVPEPVVIRESGCPSSANTLVPNQPCSRMLEMNVFS
jgi:hypothetical protein